MQRSCRPLEAMDDRVLVHDLLGTAAACRVAHVAVPALLEADAAQLGRTGLPPAARRRLLAAGELARRFQPAARPPQGALDRPQHFLPPLTPLRPSPAEVLGVLTLDPRPSLV